MYSAVEAANEVEIMTEPAQHFLATTSADMASPQPHQTPVSSPAQLSLPPKPPTTKKKRAKNNATQKNNHITVTPISTPNASSSSNAIVVSTSALGLTPNSKNPASNSPTSSSSSSPWSKSKCPKCDKFISDKLIREHIKSHEGIKSVCNKCNKQFSYKTSLQLHVLRVHEKSRHNKKCRFCDKKFYRNRDLFSHEKKHLPKNEGKNNGNNSAASSSSGGKKQSHSGVEIITNEPVGNINNNSSSGMDETDPLLDTNDPTLDQLPDGPESMVEIKVEQLVNPQQVKEEQKQGGNTNG